MRKNDVIACWPSLVALHPVNPADPVILSKNQDEHPTDET